MRSKRVIFVLTMPGRNSWDGRWSGQDRPHNRVRTLRGQKIIELGLDDQACSWEHSFGDGWVARVSARVLAPGEKAPKSVGFAGYDWMIDNLLRFGTLSCKCEWADVPNPVGAYSIRERCINCGNTRSKALVCQ
jgi:hypothetical protein